MIIIPAIDIINGKCVRLTKGDYSTKVIYNDEPLNVAKSFADAGFQRLHIVDLDGAKEGSIQNLKVLETIAANTKLTIDFGGGIKNIADVNQVFNAGGSIITLGSIAVKNPHLIKEWIIEFGADKILIGADVLNENIRISGWTDDGRINVFDFIKSMLTVGVKNIFCTDILTDGMLKGSAVELYKRIIKMFPGINLIASGGVSKIEDIQALEEIGCKGVIIGKAIYEGNISLNDLSKFN